nr:hypothetical protein [Tanacetum cinerariifolium]GEX71540.1 hypothetical protein [Tanacetum cinerariifolium]
MTLTFADTHNMIACLTKSDASEGFDQIIDFLNASSIKYALTLTRKKVIITKATVREALRLDDTESIDCLPNEEIFTELSSMGYEKPSTKLTFYKAFFSLHWKFLIHTILQCMSAKRTSWNEFSYSMASAVICLSTGKGFSRVETPLLEGMIVAQQADDVANEGAAGVDVDVIPAAAVGPSIPSPTPTTQPPPPSQELLSISQVLPTPPSSPISQPSSPPQQPQPSQPTHDAEISMDLLQTLLETCTTLTRKVEALEQDKVAQTLEITKLKQRVKKLERKNKLKVRMHPSRGIIELIDADKDVTLEEVEVNKNAEDDELEPAELKEVVEVVTTAKLITEVVTVVPATITAATTLITAATITVAPSAARRRKRVVIKDPKETATPSIIIHTEPKFKDKGKGIMKLDEEVEELRKHLQIVPNNDDDVYTEATPLALKVPIVDYEIHTENNKPYFKIIRADGTHQLFLSFLSLLRNFNIEDLEVLWQIVKERFASSNPRTSQMIFY